MIAYYFGHDFEWPQKYMNALPKKKGLDYSKAVCIAAVLQHKYTLGKKLEVRLYHADLKLFGLTEKNLIKYLPYFVKANLIKWASRKGSAPIIVLITPPPNYIPNTNNNRLNRIIEKGTSTTVGEVTSTTVGEVTSTTVGEVAKLYNRKGMRIGLKDEEDKKVVLVGRNSRKGKKEGLVGRIGREGRKVGMVSRIGREGRKVGMVSRIGREGMKVGKVGRIVGQGVEGVQ